MPLFTVSFALEAEDLEAVREKVETWTPPPGATLWSILEQPPALIPPDALERTTEGER